METQLADALAMHTHRVVSNPGGDGVGDQMSGTDSFAQRLKSALRDRGVSGAELSRAVGCSQQAVSKWVRGECEVSDTRLRKVGDFLDVDWLWLRFGDDVVKERARRGTLSPADDLRTETFRRLLIAEERLAATVDAAALGMWDWELASNELSLSEHMASMLGLSRGVSKIPLREFLKIIHSRDVEIVTASIEEAARNGAQFHVEFRVPIRSMPMRWILFAGGFFRGRDGHSQRGVGVGKDISSRKRIVERLRAERDWFLRLFDRSTTLLIVLDGNGNVLKCNEKVRQTLGMREEELVGREFRELIAAWARRRDYYQMFAFETSRYLRAFDTDARPGMGDGGTIHWYVERVGSRSRYIVCGHLVDECHFRTPSDKAVPRRQWP
jgi:PAS domain-containing protein